MRPAKRIGAADCGIAGCRRTRVSDFCCDSYRQRLAATSPLAGVERCLDAVVSSKETRLHTVKRRGGHKKVRCHEVSAEDQTWFHAGKLRDELNNAHNRMPNNRQPLMDTR